MRLRFHCKTILCCGIALAFCFDLSAQDWPQWRGAQSNGKAKSENLTTSDFQLALGWQRELGSAYSNVSVVGNHVITIYTDGKDDFLVSLNIADGEELWRQKVGATFQGTQGSEDGASSSPCIVDETVIAFGPNGDLIAVQLQDGKELWRKNLRDLLEARTPWYGFGSSPFRCGDAVFLPISTPDGTSGILFDPKDGSTIWKCQGNQVNYQGGYWIEDRNELVIADTTNISVIDTAKGTQKFRTVHSKNGDLASPQLTPVSDSQVLMTFENQAVLCDIDRDNKKFNGVWTSRELRDSYSPPVCHGDSIYGMCGTFLVCVDRKTGKRLWKSRQPGARGISLVNNVLMLFSFDGELVCVDASREGYNETSRVKVADRGSYTAPVFAHNRVIVRNTSSIACAVLADQSNVPVTSDTSDTVQEGLFTSFLAEVSESSDPQAAVEKWWKKQKSFPVVENDSTVHFVFRRDAQDVAVLGDMTQDRHAPETMKRVKNTDLFYKSFENVPNGLWHYAFLVDFDNVVCDPQNDVKVPALIDMGGNPRSTGYDNHKFESVLMMPDCRQPDFLNKKSNQPEGEIETLEFKSSFRWITKKPLQVYLPAGYEKDEETKYPVIYLLGGKEWFDHASAKVAFDNLMGTTCEKAIVVSIPYHDGSGDRIGGAGYSKLVLNDAVPLIEKEFRTRAPAVAFGAADDATAAIHLPSMSPERFSRLVVFSPYMDEPDFQSLEKLKDFPERCYLDWSRYEPRIMDENSDYLKSAEKLNELFKSNGCSLKGGQQDTGPGWKSWVLRLDHALEFVLPLGE